MTRFSEYNIVKENKKASEKEQVSDALLNEFYTGGSTMDENEKSNLEKIILAGIGAITKTAETAGDLLEELPRIFREREG